MPAIREAIGRSRCAPGHGVRKVNPPMPDDKPDDYLLYDGQCDACSAYVHASRLKGRAGFAVLDARKEPELVAGLRRKGVEINETMVIRVRGKTYAGPDATRMIAELATDASAPARGLLHADRHRALVPRPLSVAGAGPAGPAEAAWRRLIP